MSSKNPKHPALRDVAVLVASLDPQMAEVLLSRFTPEQASRVRQAILELDEPPASQQRLVLAEFVEMLRSTTAEGAPAEESVVIAPSEADTPTDQEPRVDQPTLPDVEQVSPLHAASSIDQIARLMKAEHPQTVAAVLSTLAPPRAALLIQSLPPGQQYEVVRRIAEMEPSDVESLLEVEQELREQIQREHEDEGESQGGWDAVRSILDSADGKSRSDIIDNLVRFDAALADRLAETAGRNGDAAATGSSVENQYRTAISFDRLADLDGQLLETLFQLVPHQTAVTALAGASHGCVHDLMSRLPRNITERLRESLAAIGPLRLSEIHEAQATIVKAARGLAKAQAGGSESSRLRLSA